MDFLTSLMPTLLMVIGGIITWFLKSKVEELRAIEEKLREDRREIYRKIIEPYVILFSAITKKGKNIQEAIDKISSNEYRKTAFELILFGSDDVVHAYNDFMQYAYKAANVQYHDPEKFLRLWGKFLLEIRKNLGNKKSKLYEFDMLRWMIIDIDKVIQKE